MGQLTPVPKNFIAVRTEDASNAIKHLYSFGYELVHQDEKVTVFNLNPRCTILDMPFLAMYKSTSLLHSSNSIPVKNVFESGVYALKTIPEMHQVEEIIEAFSLYVESELSNYKEYLLDQLILGQEKEDVFDFDYKISID